LSREKTDNDGELDDGIARGTKTTHFAPPSFAVSAAFFFLGSL
jgi:hypothetical protein